ncbi:MFS transporter [Candidatus Bathyarchaeota archaeon]|nr:MFS transporter [Candidatus Bathyarchaeota archaeon]MBL7080380.1 MFS transporter [Candidatus Bathyarchaeota archaeon]
MVLDDLKSFFSRQARNYQLVLVKKAGFSFFNKLTQDYINIYIRLLGANFVQLGLVGSVGGLVNAIIAYPFGSLIDRYSSRKILMLTITAQALVPLTYFYARDWMWIAVATALYTLAFFCSSGVENVVLANSLKDEDRATGFSFVTALSLVPTVVAPLAAGALLTRLGGLTAGNVRYLFIIELVGVAIIGLYVGLRLEETGSLGKRSQSLVEELKSVMSGGPYLKRWLLIDTMSASSFAVMARFVMVYAVEEKGADPLTLGAMSTIFAVVGIVSAIPLGNLADRIGRVRTVLLLRPLFHISTLILLFAPDPRWIILGWALRGTFQPSLSILAAYRNELVPPSERGKWMGIRELLRGIFRIPAPLIGGILYSQVSPLAPFLFHMFVDVFLRMPLLLTMPRTLKVAKDD